MHKSMYMALFIAGVMLTAISVVYAYEERGFFAVGGEYAFLALPLLGNAVEALLEE